MAEPKCPICFRRLDDHIEARLRPFCSRRCADVDLGRWLTETYRVPTTETEDEAADHFQPE